MSLSIDIVLCFYFLFASFIIFIISFFLIQLKVIKNIEKRYNTKLDYPLFIKSSLSKSSNVADYILYLYLIKLNILKYKEPVIIKPLLHHLNYDLKDETKINIIICLIFYISTKTLILLFISIGLLTGVFQEMYVLFTSSMEYTNKCLFNTSMGFLLVYLLLTPFIKFKILKSIETKYNVKIENNLNFLLFKYFDVSNYIKDLFLYEKKIFKIKMSNYLIKPKLSEFPYTIKSESNINIFISIIHAYSLKLFIILSFIFIIGLTFDFVLVFGDK
ncbi:hypothetical protein GCL60_06815 [Silvanigrella paludirubra]|uniref:Uncharacterized protein n=1 Tax=Silvanigrella paludirubra TaxID=2499159 RepID=A0A6N6VZL3_9BACT|nr:hypothetical protein [Silvanigrella paludirubra]KAB8039968.1 hypothetical protein GCL60_06815 [Silvanigrella paludirubra]